MSYILMTRMQYLHLTGVIPRMSGAFEDEWEKENRKRFERNHPMSCRHRDDEHRKNEKIYQKFNFGRRPKEPLSGDGLIQAIKICSERPDQCFYLEEALCQLGHHNTYSYEDRFNALLITTHQTGQAVLVEEGFGGGASPVSKPKEEGFLDKSVYIAKETLKGVDALVETTVAETLNTGAKVAMNVGALPIGLYHGIKEGSVDAGITALRETRDGSVDNYKINIRESSKEILGNNPTLQTVGEAIHDRTDKFYDSVNYFGGEEAENLVRGATEAYLDMGFVAGAKLSFDQLMKAPIKTYQTGGRIVLDGNSLEGWDQAIKHYDIIRKDPNDVANIVKIQALKIFMYLELKTMYFLKIIY